MTTKAVATAHEMNDQGTQRFAAVDECLEEMALIRKRMKSTAARIRRADGIIRRSLNEAKAILRHVQASRWGGPPDGFSAPRR